jgi:nucleotide-binding universal stress UspA family protein
MTEGFPGLGRGPVIAGFDGRPAGHDALALAGALAAARGDELIATWVSESLHPFAANDRRRSREVMQRIREVRAAVDQTLPERRTDQTVAVRDIAAPSPARGLHDLARSEKAQAIVLGSSHHGAVGRVAVGTTGARLLVKPTCAVAVAPAGFAERRHRSIEQVAVAVDGCRHCQGALQEAMALTSALAGRLVALAAAPNPGVVERVDEMLERCGARGVKRMVLDGSPVRAIARAADEFDLLILGCRTSGGAVGHPSVGSVSRALMRKADVPVLVVPETVPLWEKPQPDDTDPRMRAGSRAD